MTAAHDLVDAAIAGKDGSADVLSDYLQEQLGWDAETARWLAAWLGPSPDAPKDGPVLRRLLDVPLWTETAARMLVCDLAELVLPRWEDVHPEDDRPHRMIAAQRRLAEGLPSGDDEVLEVDWMRIIIVGAGLRSPWPVLPVGTAEQRAILGAMWVLGNMRVPASYTEAVGPEIVDLYISPGLIRDVLEAGRSENLDRVLTLTARRLGTLIE